MLLVFGHIARVVVGEGKIAPRFATIPRLGTERPVPYVCCTNRPLPGLTKFMPNDIVKLLKSRLPRISFSGVSGCQFKC